MSIWLLAFCYAAAYSVFGVFTHKSAAAAVTMHGPHAGRAILLAGLAGGLIAVLPVFVALLRKRAPANGADERDRAPPFYLVASGFAASLIALSTVAAFSFGGVSLVLALLLMRAGVLILSPIIDFFSRRPIKKSSAIALGLSLAAACGSLLFVDKPVNAPLLFAVLGVYVSAYSLRLSLMSRFSKTHSKGARAAYAVGEFFWMTFFLIVFIVLVSVFLTSAMDEFSWRNQFQLLPVGLAYAFVLLAGTLIYLHPRENSFTITINRGAGLLGGMIGATIASFWGVAALPPSRDFLAASVILIALVILALSEHRADSLRGVRSKLGSAVQRLR